ncbi:MAG TPA: SRPBCC domain-containing protein, partial [Flavobacteriales bacterium]|nr:SRPBCC domain-containing protein [Flavobacteriales bacterium]
MNDRDYTRMFTVPRTPQEAYDAICNVKGWWTIHTDGDTAAVGDEFTVHFGDVHRTTQRITEADPGRKVVWQVTQSWLPWLKD